MATLKGQTAHPPACVVLREVQQVWALKRDTAMDAWMDSIDGCEPHLMVAQDVVSLLNDCINDIYAKCSIPTYRRA